LLERVALADKRQSAQPDRHGERQPDAFAEKIEEEETKQVYD
jgi:hypothetical protein